MSYSIDFKEIETGRLKRLELANNLAKSKWQITDVWQYIEELAEPNGNWPERAICIALLDIHRRLG